MRNSTRWAITAVAGMGIIAATATACTLMSMPETPTCASTQGSGQPCTVPAYAGIPEHTLDGIEPVGLTEAQEEARLAKIGRSTLPTCPTEDSNNCQWDARYQGNGQGRSFVTIDGETIYTTEGN